MGDKLLQTWQEAVEREVVPGEIKLPAAEPQRTEFAFPGGRRMEPVRGPDGDVVGVVVREQQAVAGLVETTAEPAGDDLFKVRVRDREPDAAGGRRRRTATRRCCARLVSTHTILGVRDGEFVSLLDPPAEDREAAAGCRNVGTYPVLVGEAGERDMMLSSPIILYDYPQIGAGKSGRPLRRRRN